MDDNLRGKMLGLIQLYKQTKREDKNIYYDYSELMGKYRIWQRENILDYDKLTNYSDEQYAKVFWEMWDYSDGSLNSHNRVRGHYFKTPEQRLEVRARFEKTIKHIVESSENRFELLEEILDKNSGYKISGLGSHIMTTLVNAQYSDIPVINETTAAFFRRIGWAFPSRLSEQQRAVSEFFNEMVSLSNDELTFDDINLMLWFATTNESAKAYMDENFPNTDKKTEQQSSH